MIDTQTFAQVKRALLIGFGLVVAGAFLPWAERDPFSETGLEGNGVLTLAFAAIGILVTLTDRRPRGMLIAVSVAALSLLVGVVDYVDIALGEVASVGAGLYVTVLGAAIATLTAGVLAFSLFKRPQPDSSERPERLP